MMITRRYHCQLRPNLRQGFYFFPPHVYQNVKEQFVHPAGIEPARPSLAKGF